MPAINSNAPSSAGFPSSGHRAWRRFTFNRDREEFGDIDGQRGCDAIEEVDRHVEIAALDTADGRAVDASIYSKVLLRDLLVGAHLSQIPCKSITSIHGRMATTLKAGNPSDISDIFQFWREVCVAGDKQ